MPIKFNLIHIWPDKIICYQSQWPNRLELQKQILEMSVDDSTLLNRLSECLSILTSWHPTKVIIFGNKLIYRLIGHQTELSHPEFIALVEHQLQKVQGRKATEYVNLTQQIHYAHNNLGVGIDKQWLNAIQSVVASSSLYLIDIEPAATWLFNALRKKFIPDAWNIVTIDCEVYFFKFKDKHIEHFKVIAIKKHTSILDITNKEILMLGDDPEQVDIRFYDLMDLTKKEHSFKINPHNRGVVTKNVQ